MLVDLNWHPAGGLICFRREKVLAGVQNVGVQIVHHAVPVAEGVLET
jgi:hypothetical protein